MRWLRLSACCSRCVSEREKCDASSCCWKLTRQKRKSYVCDEYAKTNIDETKMR